MSDCHEMTFSDTFLGILIYITVYAVGTVLLFPGAVLTLGEGFAWGVVTGIITTRVSNGFKQMRCFMRRFAGGGIGGEGSGFC